MNTPCIITLRYPKRRTFSHGTDEHEFKVFEKARD
jgi:hypothetical protein